MDGITLGDGVRGWLNVVWLNEGNEVPVGARASAHRALRNQHHNHNLSTTTANDAHYICNQSAPYQNQQVEVGEEPGLEYGDESEDELLAAGELCAGGGPPPLRFKLLHNLW